MKRRRSANSITRPADPHVSVLGKVGDTQPRVSPPTREQRPAAPGFLAVMIGGMLTPHNCCLCAEFLSFPWEGALSC